jgi:crotonobetainyl-CoA:carnitine CoA-transferase CaiB-like acyl-CoA transferase
MPNTTHLGPLASITVLDLSTTEAGRFCGTLLADLGARVVRADDGQATRRDNDEFVNQVLLRNRIIIGDGGAAALERHLHSSDAVLVDEGSRFPEGWDVERCGRVNPAIVRCWITPFGTDGPWRGRFGGDLTVQAHSGFMELTGEPGRPPIRMGARVLPLMAGATAAVELVSCLLRCANVTGADIDVSVLDVALNTLTYMAPMYLTFGQVPGKVGSGHTTIYPYNAFEVADGYIVAAPFTGRFWRNFCQALGAPEWGTDPRFKDFQNRLDNRAILEPMLNARMKAKTRDEWLKLLEAADVPCGPVNSVAEAIDMDVSLFRGLVIGIENGAKPPIRALGLPLKITNSDGEAYKPCYREASASLEEISASPGGLLASADGTVRPLAGIRVLDLTRMAAGPYCTQMLVDLGAEVIKVEEPGIGDPTRRNVPMIGALSSYFYAFNRGKKSVSLDMKTPEGHAIVKQLMAEVDVVVENFRPGVMKRLGLDFVSVSKNSPGLVVASISGFGQTGPLREKISFDLVNQAIAGMLSITSDPGREPARLGMAVGDLGGGLFACLGVVSALKQRERTGLGAHIDVSLHDVLVTLLGGLAQDYLSSGEVPGPMGSEHAGHVPERAFATSDGWIVLEAWTDEGWAQLVAEPGFDALRDDRFAQLAGRRAARAEIHEAMKSIIASQSTRHWMSSLQKSGIGVAPVAHVGQALDSEHVAARNLVVTNALPDGMTGRTMGSAFRINGRHIGTDEPPPTLGENNAEFLGTCAREGEMGLNA